MALVIILNFLILCELGVSIYNYADIKTSIYDKDNGDKSKKLSLTNLLIIAIIISLINIFYFTDIINLKRTILNLILLSIVSSVFLYISYNYLLLESQNHPNYKASKITLDNNTDNINKTIKDTNLITATITLILTLLICSFYIGYKFFSRVETKIIEKPFVLEKVKKNFKKPKLNLIL